MAWTAPTTWVTSQLVTASDLNTHIRDNLNALKAPPSDFHLVDEGADYTIAATTWTDVDATNLALTITTTAASTNVLIGFTGVIKVNNTSLGLNVYLDTIATQIVGDMGLAGFNSVAAGATIHAYNMSFVYPYRGLAAGTHTFKLQWKVSNNSSGRNATMYAGAGTTDTYSADFHPSFWVTEIG